MKEYNKSNIPSCKSLAEKYDTFGIENCGMTF